MSKSTKKGDVLLSIKGLKIQGFSDEKWHDIINGIDLTLHTGEVLGLIGESGAGKSTLGLAAMGYTQPGCRITEGEIIFDGVDLAKLTDGEKRKFWGTRMTYVAQSAAAAFNPAPLASAHPLEPFPTVSQPSSRFTKNNNYFFY